MTNHLIIGMPKEQIPTPSLILDLDIFEANLYAMAKLFTGQVKLRPHIKTHKCPVIAHLQVKAGAIGITCAKLSEAEVMVGHGITDILIANQVAGYGKAERLGALATRVDVKVAVDNPANVDDLDRGARMFGAQIGVVIEVNVGNDRCGTRSMEQTLELAKHIATKKGLIFKGLMGYEGHCVFTADKKERTGECLSANKILVDSAQMLRDNGFKVEIVSAGGTGTYDMSGIYPGITEVEAGSYVFMDSCYSGILGNDVFRPSLRLLATVISKPQPGLALIDAGMKSLTFEFGKPQPLLQGATLTGLSEEHGRLELTPEADTLQVGDLVEIWPTHGCTTVNLHDRYCVVKENRLVAVWEIACRGMSQ
ncbi:MAG: DSD1 family PLP-dependent enzyme [Prevotellaceae bacterium]|nr:DSD1 family PLP-dependent enzyme [Prevotellaceae bacterium]